MSVDGWLAGKHAIVTGGGRGIGAAIARELAGMGARVTLIGRDEVRLNETAEDIAKAVGSAVSAYSCDVTQAESVNDVFERAMHNAGDAYILVNNAGQAEGASFVETTPALWDRLIAVNLTGTYLCTQQVVPAMVANGAGRIINIASTAGLKGYARVTAYCAAKHGVVGFTRALAAEVARTGVTVNAVCPSYVDTEMTDRTVAAIAQRTQASTEEARKRLERTIPIGRLIRPEEVAAAVAWLCTPAAASVTAQAIAVDGGETQ
ncbi:MAG: SDR family NAD(P)-dependent oxidoreductase [Gemmatimonadota bacterium]